MKPDRERELVCPVTVEFEDVDAYGIAHHTKLVAYLERARLRFLTGIGIELGRGPVVPVLYDLKMRFMKPARLLDSLEVSVFVEEVTEYRLDLGYRVRRDGETIARATTSIAYADLERGSVVPAPAEHVEALRAALVRDPE